MTNEAKILGAISVVTLAIVIGAAVIFGGKSTADKPAHPVNQKNLIRTDSHEIKAPGAKVTLVEFCDFQCPACGAAYPVVSQLVHDYKGKINFVFREYPLPMHEHSKAAASA